MCGILRRLCSVFVVAAVVAASAFLFGDANAPASRTAADFRVNLLIRARAELPAGSGRRNHHRHSLAFKAGANLENASGDRAAGRLRFRAVIRVALGNRLGRPFRRLHQHGDGSGLQHRPSPRSGEPVRARAGLGVTSSRAPQLGRARALPGAALCSYRTPKAARGKTLRGAVTIVVEGTALTRKFAVRLR
jgi:hypothetical protein